MNLIKKVSASSLFINKNKWSKTFLHYRDNIMEQTLTGPDCSGQDLCYELWITDVPYLFPRVIWTFACMLLVWFQGLADVSFKQRMNEGSCCVTQVHMKWDKGDKNSFSVRILLMGQNRGNMNLCTKNKEYYNERLSFYTKNTTYFTYVDLVKFVVSHTGRRAMQIAATDHYFDLSSLHFMTKM